MSIATSNSKDFESDLIDSYLDDKYNTGAKSNQSKKSKYTSNSKLTKSSLFKTINKKEESQSQRGKELEIQIHLLKGSL